MFVYEPAITERFPTVRAGLAHVTGIVNDPPPVDLTAAYLQEQEDVKSRVGDSPIADLPSITAWRRVFAGFGVKPTQYRVAAEALLRRLTKKGDIPSISTLVDIGNLVSIRYAMPVAVVDPDGITGGITVRFADGDEPFTDLGATEISHPDRGEVVFVDGDGVVCARRWCWRQSDQSATGTETTQALFIVEGHHETAADDTNAAIADIASLLSAHQPDSQVKISSAP